MFWGLSTRVAKRQWGSFTAKRREEGQAEASSLIQQSILDAHKVWRFHKRERKN